MLISVNELVRGTLKLYAANFKHILKYLMVIMIMWALVWANGLIGVGYAVNFVDGIALTLLTLAIQLIGVGLFFLVNIAFTRTLSNLITNQSPPTMMQQIKGASRVFIPSLVASFLLGAAVLAGMLLFIIPGVVFSVWFYFTTYATMIDGHKPIAALKASKALVTGRFGQVLWRLIAPAVLYVMVFSTGAWIILTPGEYFLAATGSFPGYLLTVLLAILFYFLLFPVITITPILLYEHLKRTPVQPE